MIIQHTTNRSCVPLAHDSVRGVCEECAEATDKFMQQIPMIVKAKAPIIAFHYALVSVESESPAVVPIPYDRVVCAYCGQLTPPGRQAARAWFWPGKGWVTNCVDCAGIHPSQNWVNIELAAIDLAAPGTESESVVALPPCGAPPKQRTEAWPPIPGSKLPTRTELEKREQHAALDYEPLNASKAKWRWLRKFIQFLNT